MPTFTWAVEQMEREADSGGVTAAYWRAIAEDDGHRAEAYGSVSFAPDPAAPGFVPFTELTEAEVLAWVWTSVQKDDIETALSTAVAAMKQPVVVAGLPW
jgi:hypothetical protein